MKWRPRISIPLGKGFRINVGKRGIGASAGIPGLFRVGMGSDGRMRTTVGSGLLRWEHQSSASGQPPGCGCGTLIMVLVILGAISAGKRDDSTNKPPPALAAGSTQPLMAGSRIPLFREPTKAAAVPLDLGLRDTREDRPAWRSGPNGWQALATLVTHRGDPFKKGDLDNGIDCHHESKSGARVERVTWTAKVFNPAGQHATLPRFKEICLDYAARLGCALPKGLFVKVDPEKGQRMETADAVFEIDKLRFDEGYAWRFRITSK